MAKVIILFGLQFGAATIAHAELLWDNGKWDTSNALSSERETFVDESTTVDDVIFEQPVHLTGFSWTSLMTRDGAPRAADLVLLTDDFSPLQELRDLTYSRVLVGENRGLNVYEVTLQGLSMPLAVGNYYIGGRMVGGGDSFRAFSGLNVTVRGETQAYFRSAFFGFPDWTPTDEIFGTPRDMSFRVFGEIVPEPPTILAIAGPILIMLRQRRKSL